MANQKSVNEPSRGVNAGECFAGANLKFSLAGDKRELLEPLRGGIVADEVLEYGQDVLAILNNPLEQRAELRLAHGFLIPLGEDGGGDLNILA